MTLVQAKLGRVRAWRRLARLLPDAGAGILIPLVLLVLLSGLLPTAFIVLMGRVMTDLTSRPPGASGLSGALGLAGPDLVLAFAALAVQQIVAPWLEALAQYAGRRIDRHTLDDMLGASLRAPLERIEDRRAASLVSEVSEAFQRNAPTPGSAAAVLPLLIGRYLQLISAVVLLAVTISVPVALLLLVGALVIRYGQRGSLDTFTAEWARLRPDRQKVAYLQSLGTETGASKEVRTLGLLDWLLARFQRDSEAYLHPLWRARRRVFFKPFLAYTAVGFVVALTAFSVLAFSYSPAAGVVTLAVAVQAVLVPLRFGVHFPECDVQTQYGLLHQSELDEYHEMVGGREPALAEPVGDGRPGQPPEVRLSGIRFGYPRAADEVLRGLDLTLPAGRSTALVGVNGAGKTTLVKLLCGAYSPTAGALTIDGQDLRDLDNRGWSRSVAVIFQHFVRFDLTLRDNLALGAVHRPPDEAAMTVALERANAADIVARLPHGLDTVLSPEYEGGAGLSGGQWQRIALARAFYAVELGARVLVLDEPTAQLDARSEVDFYDRFLELTEGLTTLVISHRFSTVRRADSIAVLQDGVITESGTHERLVESNGTYAEMFRTQAARFQHEAEVAR